MFKDNELEKVIELYKNNSLGMIQADNTENSPRENFKTISKKNNSLSMVQEGYTEKFQNGTEEIYIDEEDDEMEF